MSSLNKSKHFPLVALFSNQIAFDNPVTAYPQKTITGPVTFTPLVTGATAGYGAILRVVANGTNVPDLTAFKKVGPGTYDNTNGKVNQLVFYFDGVDYCVGINVLGVAQAQTTPSINGMTLDSSGIAVTFDRSVTGSTSGWTFKKNGIAMTITGVTQPTSSVLAFTYSGTVTGSDTITASYDSTTGNTVDGSSNELVTFTNQSVTNNVNGNITPAAPTAGTVDDTLDIFSFTLVPGYTASEHEYSLKGAAYVGCTSNQINVGNIAVAAGELLVRVKAATGRNAGATLANAQPFTVAAASSGNFSNWGLKTNFSLSSSTLTATAPNATAGSSAKIAAGAAGWLEFTVQLNAGWTALLGLDEQGGERSWTQYRYMVYGYNSLLNYGSENVSVTSTQAIANGGRIRLEKVSNGAGGFDMKVKYSSDGTTYTTVYTYTGISDVDLYLVAYAINSGDSINNVTVNNVA